MAFSGTNDLNSASTLAYDSTAHTITISNAFAADAAAPQTYTFTLNGITNPPTSETTASFSISTRNTANIVYDTITTGLTITATPNYITAVEVYPCYDDLYSITNKVCNYRLRVQMSAYSIQTGSIIVIDVPSEAILNAVAAPNYSKTSGVDDSQAKFTASGQ